MGGSGTRKFSRCKWVGQMTDPPYNVRTSSQLSCAPHTVLVRLTVQCVGKNMLFGRKSPLKAAGEILWKLADRF
jgi:hypothetical protein